MVANKAGNNAANHMYIGFFPENGFIIHPRPSFVVANSFGTINFGVSKPT
jgi:hypothetical protein